MKWAIWALSAIFFFYEFFIRVAPSVMVPELMATFGITATAIGSLSGFYYYIYAPMQIPVGVLTDRYGARKLLAIAALIVGIGTFLFSISEHFFVAALGRLLMGGGSAFGFVGMVYVCSHWFPAKKRGILIGLANAIGMVGAIMGQGPLRLGIESMGWRATMGWLGGFGLLLAAVIYLVVRNDPPEMKQHNQTVKDPTRTLLHNLKIVTKSGQTWLNSIVSLFFYITTTGFAALWGIPFLHKTYDISIEAAGFMISMIFVGWAVGGPLIGHYSDRIQQKKLPIALASFLGGISLGLIVVIPNLPIWSLYLLLLLVGCASSGQLLTYGYSIDVNPHFAKGTAVAFTNFLTFVGGALMQPFIGFLLDFFWMGETVKGLRVYGAHEYRYAVLCFPICFFLAALLALFLKNPAKIQKAKA
ncbi:MAG: putative sulfoacetate transporter SauU [Chlamydiae bacterium]|nr:putative sulfoacetate transporter SauU [Chlamydiota bacterium]